MHKLKTWRVFSSSGLGEDNSINQNLHDFFSIVMAFGPHFHYNKRCPCTSSEFIGYSEWDLVGSSEFTSLVNGD
jgi:hypothetical protein